MCSGELSLQARPDSNFYSQVSLINFTFPPFDQDLFFFSRKIADQESGPLYVVVCPSVPGGTFPG